ncbi:MAG: ABC transporter permease [Treponema sp.]|nr:ABC transporter permease [Treponema sp.]
MNDKIKFLTNKAWELSKFRELGLVFIIIILAIVVQSRNSEFLTPRNIDNLFTNTAILAILSVGMMMVLLTGGIDLSIGSIVAFSGMVVGITVKNFPDIPPAILVAQGALIGAAIGLVTGTLVARFSILPIIATLGMMHIVRGLTFIVSGGAWVSAHQMPDSFKDMAQNTFLGINNLVVIAIVIFIIFTIFINFTRTGRRIYAVGSNRDAADIIGLPRKRIVTLVYALMGLLAGIGGVLWVSLFASAQGDTATGYEIFVIASCVLGGVAVSGGRGNVFGLLLGVLLFGLLANALPLIHVSPFWQQAIMGFVILFAIIMNVLIKRNNDRANLRRRVI